MQSLLTRVVPVLLLAGALAGCAGEESLGMKVTEAADPVTEAFTFKATGSADRFLWDFGDGTGTVEGRTVEHTFGFTDGTISVRLTAESGETTDSVTRELTLGTGQNKNPQGAMEANTDWLTPGDAFVLSGAATTDENGDPILYRWSCKALGEPIPFINDGHTHAGGGVPFGVHFLATKNPNLPAADRSIEGDFCEGLNADAAWGRDASVGGSFPAVGVYELRMEARDPKSPAQIGQHTVYVTNSIPDAQLTYGFEGSLPVGTGGSVPSEVTDETGETDVARHDFTVDLPSLLATIDFSVTSTVPLNTDLSYVVKSGNTVIVPASSEARAQFGAGTFVNGKTYTLEVTAGPGSVAADYTLDVMIDQDVKYYHLWEPPAA